MRDPPPAPAGYTAQTGGLLVALSWAVSPSATGYILEAGSARRASPTCCPRGVGNVTTFTATAPAGTYYTRVRAMNDCGVSAAASVEVPVTLGCSAEAVVPGGLTVTKSGRRVFSWLPPLGATGYRIRAGTAPGISNLADVDVGASTAVAVNLAGCRRGSTTCGSRR